MYERGEAWAKSERVGRGGKREEEWKIVGRSIENSGEEKISPQCPEHAYT